MRTHTWDPEGFAATLEAIKKRAGLTEAQLAVYAGISRSQMNRWSRSENQPAFGSLSPLVNNLVAQHPTTAGLAAKLVAAAGYGVEFEPGEVDEASAATATPPVDLWPGLEWDDLDEAERMIWHLPGTNPATRLQLMRIYAVLEKEMPETTRRIREGHDSDSATHRRANGA